MKQSGPTRVCRLWRASQLMLEGSTEWDDGRVRQYFFPRDVQEILKIKLPANKTSDSIAWQYEKSGIFSVKSAYRLALTRAKILDAMGSSSAQAGEPRVWKKVWKMPVLPKVRNFIWKMIKNGLPTNGNRCYRHIMNDALCEM
jgi:hypothetical protein